MVSSKNLNKSKVANDNYSEHREGKQRYVTNANSLDSAKEIKVTTKKKNLQKPTSDSSGSSIQPSMSERDSAEGVSDRSSRKFVSSWSPQHHLQREGKHSKVKVGVSEVLFPENTHNRNQWTQRGAYELEKDAVDEYGKGSSTDRLQFGYSPSIVEEAKCFHQQFSPSQWIAERRKIGKLVYGKNQKNSVLHCALLVPGLKLRSHWKQQSLLQSKFNMGPALHLQRDDEKFDSLLKLFASQQGMLE